jgi:hypothetical protein
MLTHDSQCLQAWPPQHWLKTPTSRMMRSLQPQVRCLGWLLITRYGQLLP